MSDAEKQTEWVLPKDAKDLFTKADGLQNYRDKLIRLPFSFKKCRKLSIEIERTRRDAWDIILSIYPELKGKNASAHTPEGSITILNNKREY